MDEETPADSSAAAAEDAPVDDQSAREAMAEKLRGFYERAGIPLPDNEALLASVVSTHLPPDDMASVVASWLGSRTLLFRRGDQIGTIDEETGEWRVMTTHRFRTWLPRAGLMPWKGGFGDTGKPKKGFLRPEDVTAILSSDALREQLPEIRQINQVKLPVFRDRKGEDGKPLVELLKQGYDSESGTFTIHGGLDYPVDMEPEYAKQFFEQLLRYFQMDDRSRAVQVSAMLTCFCRMMVAGRPPMILWNSNRGGSGKSRLSQLALWAVFGDIESATWKAFDSNDHNSKTLDSCAQNYGDYLWCDNVKTGAKVQSEDLARWLTQENWGCRVMQTKEWWKGPIKAMTFMTGNKIELDEEIQRRTLICDIFVRQAAQERAIPEDAMMLEAPFFRSLEQRKEVLAAMWALVRHWATTGQEKGSERALVSFEGWSAVCPAIVEASTSFGSALGAFEAPDTGDTMTRDFETLVRALVSHHCPCGESGQVVTTEDIVRRARYCELFVEKANGEPLLGSLDELVQELPSKRNFEWKPDVDQFGQENEPDDAGKRYQAAGYMDGSMKSSWGKLFRKAAVAGQWFEVELTLGEKPERTTWEFGDRTSGKRAKFELRRVVA